MVPSCVSASGLSVGMEGIVRTDVRGVPASPLRPLYLMAFCVVLGIEFGVSCVLGKPRSHLPSGSLSFKSIKQSVLAYKPGDLD